MDKIQEAASVLHRDGIIVYPTETVYGLGADALSEHAIHRVYEVKQRLLSKPMSVAVSDIEMLNVVARVGEEEEKFVKKFLPGPVTVVLPSTSCLPEVLTGGTGLIGVRMPDHEIAQAIIKEFDMPITSTSANISGREPPVRFDQVTVTYDLFVDGGTLSGTPSTVVDLVHRQILRAGARVEEIGQFLSKMD
ncbi:MAG: L-threonylcarbamoyladenylate synthase [Euryarchaeota archaeon]|nr:L-threonylcarbamoyladenylate synthase [Euryarchaeota archaeon]